ncbi:dnaJ homolog subfamily C member 22-like [Gigantopelta aegis]|uniref:dnaJ homolog subfamily C member 22-like n=1 Tax=Gigantopelta aegis TaxID=1735272 RepID=UPI001B88C89E|nr:dnaJ homolog subfamily C member 22-like [Gigantopelta aegis]
MVEILFKLPFLLWLFGGLLGLHHFYLGRDRHGFSLGYYILGIFLLQDVAMSQVLSSLEVLGFNRTVNIEEEITEGVLKEHYKKLIRVWHPDKHPSDKKEEAQTKFIEIQEAYETVERYLKIRKEKHIFTITR